jgi:PAS domain S-box-containing protein
MKFREKSDIFAGKDQTIADMPRELEMLNSLFEYATEGIIICDQSGVIQLSNPAAERMFGYEKDGLKGKKIEVLLPARFHHKHVKERENYTSKPEPRTMGHGRDLFGARKDGSEIMVEVSLSPFETTHGKFVMSFVVDISERKKSEAALRVAHEKLRQTSDALSTLNADLESKVHARTEELAEAIQRLAESKKEVLGALEKEKELNELKSRFITTASHEFRTPLGTILSSASLIGRYNSEEEAEKRHKHIDRIKSAVNNLTEILNDFLSVEKLEEGVLRSDPEFFDLEKLLSDSCEDMQNTAKKEQTIRFTFEGSKEVFLDPQLLKNAFLNLLSNAIKYSPEEKPIAVKVISGNEKIKIDITDNGIGIPENDQQNIFERFYRAGNSGNIQGTGLGLNIVKKYIELMKGEIYFKSKPGEGSTFTIELPANQ